MKTKTITDKEAFENYLEYEWDDLFSYPEYLRYLEHTGIKVVENEKDKE